LLKKITALLLNTTFQGYPGKNDVASAEEITAEIERRRACGRYFSAPLHLSGKTTLLLPLKK